MRKLKIINKNGTTNVFDMDTGENLCLNNKISKLSVIFGPASYQAKIIIELIPDEIEISTDDGTVIKTQRVKLK